MIRFTDLPFAEAIAAFRKKAVNLPTDTWRDIEEGMHSRAFVVAQAAKADLLADLRGAVDKAIAQGTTLRDFQRDFDKTVEKNGWWYRGKGEDTGYGFRTRTIFDTNLSVAYSQGRYAQMTTKTMLSATPYWRYRTMGDGRVRPLHRAWNDTLLPAKDPWWSSHYPPNGFRCRCYVENISADEYEELSGKDGFRTEPVPGNPDQGWSYSPGEATWGRPWLKEKMDKFASGWEDVLPWGPDKYGRPEKVAVDRPKAEMGSLAKTEGELRAALRAAIGGDEAYFASPAGERILVNQGIVDHILERTQRSDGRDAYFPFIPELIEDPFEIWVNFARNTRTGQYAVRERYVKAVMLGKEQTLGLVADTVDGMWTALTFYRGNVRAINNLRRGRLLWGR